jgi:glutamine phosphoribosylpyrophosphate amidotransferase
MCGIFGYTGNKQNAANIILEGLKGLEYRGSGKSEARKQSYQTAQSASAIHAGQPMGA